MNIDAEVQKMPVINTEDLTDGSRPAQEGSDTGKMVSKCCVVVRDYTEKRYGEDPLVKGISEDKNPFKELKGGCVIS